MSISGVSSVFGGLWGLCAMVVKHVVNVICFVMLVILLAALWVVSLFGQGRRRLEPPNFL